MGHRDYICNFEECVSRECGFLDCGRKHYARGWCNGHYKQDRKGAGMRPLAVKLKPGESLRLLWSKPPEGDGCVEWPGPRDRAGYGKASLNGGPELAHRASWKVNVGPIPDGFMIRHRCNNRPCYRVSHLRIGTHADNMKDAVESGSMKRDDNGRVKLTSDSAREIFSRLQDGEGRWNLAGEFRVDYSTIAKIATGKSWAKATADLRGAS